MIQPNELATLCKQAYTGEVPPIGNLEDAQELIGFAFGLRFNSEGQFGAPGPTSEAIAHRIVEDPILSGLPMNLQEEVAFAVRDLNPRLEENFRIVVPTVRRPGRSVTTDDVLRETMPGLQERDVRCLAVVAFRHHLPRATADVARAGFEISTPDMASVGDFDPDNSLSQCRSIGRWIAREALVFPYFAAQGKI
jgi:hypothetical protein